MGIGAETVVTLIGVFLAVAAIAAYLITIAYTLDKVSFILDTVYLGVNAIVSQVSPVDGYIKSIYGDVSAIERAVGELLQLGPESDGSRTGRRRLTRR